MRAVDHTLRPEVPGWELTRLLGTGGSAQVWHGVPVGGGRPAAVKLLSLADGTAPGAATAEAALLSGLEHPHLIGAIEAVPVRFPGTGRPGLALVLELAAGGSLADLLRRRGRLAPGEVVTAVAPVATALAYVHDQGLVHGDVTPGNLLFSVEGVPLLADLGVAKVIGGYGEVRTTAAYADPVVAGGGRPSTASDVFMLAATAFHALTGAPPWPDPLPGVALARAAKGDVAPLHRALSGVSAAVSDVLLDALRPEPHLRPSAAAFALDFGRAARPLAVDFDAGRALRLDGSQLPVWTGSPLPTGQRETFDVEPQVSPPVPAVRRPPRPVGRHASGLRRRRPRGLVVATGAVLTAVAIAVVWSTVAGADRPAQARTPVAVERVDPPGWADVLAELDARRTAAYAGGDPAPLAEVYAPGPLLDADRATLAAQVPAGCGLHGVRTGYDNVRASPAVAPAVRTDTVVLAVRATLSRSTLTCPGAADVEVDGVGPTPLVVILGTVAEGGWRITGLTAG